MKKSLTKLLIIGLTLLYSNSQFAATFTVTNTNDSGTGSFRQAITDANTASGTDNIVFAISTGAQTITLSSAITVSTTMIIDGSSQPGFSGTALITISGVNMFYINGGGANGSTVQYLAFQGNSSSTSIVASSLSNCLFSYLTISNVGSGIRFDGSGSSNTITNCNASGCVTGINFNGGSNPSFSITNNSIMNCTSWGIVYNYGTPASINNNTLTGSANGIYVGSASNLTLTPPTGTGPNKNYFGSHTGNVLSLESCNGAVLSGWNFNSIVATPYSSRVPLNLSNCSNGLFSAITSTGMSSGIFFQGSGSSNTITGSTFDNSNTGINFNGGSSPSFSITNNSIMNCTTWGILYNYGTPASINNNTLTGSANAIYIGSASNLTLTPPTGTGPNKNYFGSHTGNVFNLESCNGAVMSGWNFNSLVATPYSSRNPLNISNCSNGLFSAITSTGMSSGIFFQGSGSSNTITGSTFDNSNTGINFNGGSSPSFSITNNSIMNCTTWGILYNYGTPASINNNTLTGSANAIYIGSASNLTLTPPTGTGPNKNYFGSHTGNVFNLESCNGAVMSGWNFNSLVATPYSSRNPLNISNCSNGLFSAITSTGMSSGIFFQGSGSSNTITGSTFDNSNTGINFNGGSSPSFSITNNSIMNCTSWGILYNYGTPASINNNTLTGSTNGLYVGSASNLTLTPPTGTGPNKNYFGSHTGNVINLESCNGAVVSGWNFNSLVSTPYSSRNPMNISNCSNGLFSAITSTGMSSGIYFQGSGSSNTITGSTFDNSNTGINFNGGSSPSFSITNNSIMNCTSWGILYNYGTPASINNNTLTGSTNGLYVGSASNLTLTPPTGTGPNKNYFGSHTGNVIILESCNGAVLSGWNFNSLVSTPYSSRNPINISNCSNGLFSAITSTGMSSGIYFQGSGSSNTITGSTFDNSNTGINFNGGSSPSFSLTNNSIKNCTSWALLYNYGTPASINNNTVTGSAYGIYIGSANGFSLGSNTFGGQTGETINLTSCTSVTLNNLTTNGTSNNGIVLNSSNSCLLNNITSCGRSYGVYIQGSSNANRITNCSLSASSNGVYLNSTSVNNTTINTVAFSSTSTGVFNGGQNSIITNTSIASLSPSITVNSGAACSGQSFTMNPSGASNYTFQGGSAVVTPTANTNYTVVGTGTNGCISNIATSSVTVSSSPTISVNSGSVCGGNSFTISPTGGTSYTYQGGSSVVTPTANTNYSVIGSNSIGCTSTVTSSVTIGSCPGSALNFDGTNDYVNCGNALSAALAGSNKITVEARVKPSVVTYGDIISNYSTNSSGNIQFLLRITTAPNYEFWVGNGNNWYNAVSASVPTLNVWQHVAGTWDGSVLKIYLNGVLSGSTIPGISTLGNANGNPVWIGGQSVGAEWYNGSLDEIRIWNKANCQSEIQNNMNGELSLPQANLLAYYKFNQGIGGANNSTVTTLIDAVGANTGTLSNFALNGSTSNWISSGGVISGNTVTAFASPTVSISGTNSVCVGSSVTLTATGNVTSYVWTGGPTSSTFAASPTVNTTYSVVGTNSAGCTSSISVISVSASVSPTVSASNGTICSGTSFTITPSGASTYTFQGGSAIVSPTANASYTVRGTNTVGCISVNTATVSLNVNTSPTITVNSGSICSGQTFTISPSGGSSYTVQGGSNLVTPLSNSSYSVIGTNSTGCISNSVSSSITVNITPTITVGSGSICSGNSFSISPSGASSYTYQGGGASVSPSVNTNYSVVGASTAGCISNTVTSTVSVNITPTITVNTGSVCSGKSFTISPSGASSYSYQGGSSVVSPSVNSNYSVIGSSTAGCVSGSVTASISVSLTPTITANSGSICSGGSFSITVSGASSYTYQGGNASVSPSVNSTYTVAGTSTAGCISNTVTSSVTVNITPTITVNSGSVCSGNSFSISPNGASSYTYQGGNASVSPSVNSTYSVTGTSTAGCISNTVTSSVTVNTTPTITVNSGSICSGSSFSISPTGASSYTYQGGNASVSPSVNSNYTIVGSSTVGCISNTVTSTVTVYTTPTITVNSGSICSGQSFTIVPSGASNYTIQGGSATVTPNANSSYTVIGESTTGCVSSSFATSNVTVSPSPTITVNNGTICIGESFTMVPGGASNYTFEGGNAVVNPTISTSYTVVGSDSFGCVSQTFATSGITVNALPVISISGNATICLKEAFILTANGADTYSWSSGSTSQSITESPSVSTTYSVLGTLTLTGCKNGITANVVVDPCTGLNSVSNKIIGISVYPNPSSGEFNIELNNDSNKLIEVYDVLGRIVYLKQSSADKMNVNIKHLDNGIYYLIVRDNNRISETIKIIKE